MLETKGERNVSGIVVFPIFMIGFFIFLKIRGKRQRRRESI